MSVASNSVAAEKEESSHSHNFHSSTSVTNISRDTREKECNFERKL
jgi:hypothetical protein